jgi:hypothetical protein
LTKNEGAPGEHPLFRAMVVMGGSLAVGCGATVATGETKSGPHSGSSSGGAANMGDAPTGGRPDVEPIARGAGGSVGTNTPGTGGKASIVTGAGGAVTGSGGAAGVGGTSAGGASEGLCSRAQLSCDAETLRCGLNGGQWDLPAGCTCDAKRPGSGADCATDELFVCRQGNTSTGGSSLPPLLVYFDCACVPKTDDCSNACKAAFRPGFDGFECHVEPGPNSDIVLCGCGWVFLR